MGSIPVFTAPPDQMRLGLQASLAERSRAPHIVEQLQRRDVEAQKMEDVARIWGSAMAMRLKTERTLCEQARTMCDASVRQTTVCHVTGRERELSSSRACAAVLPGFKMDRKQHAPSSARRIRRHIHRRPFRCNACRGCRRRSSRSTP